jgi:hypothetical protein
VEWRYHIQEKKGKDFILGYFYIILNLGYGENLCHSPSPMAFEPRRRAGLPYAYTYANSGIPSSFTREEISTLV